MTEPTSGLLARSKGLLEASLDLLKTRLELFVVEAQEEQARLGAILTQGAIAVFFLCFGLLFLAVFFTVLFWDSNRLLVLGAVSAVFLTVGAFAYLRLKQELARKSRLFAASLAELRRDLSALDKAGDQS